MPQHDSDSISAAASPETPPSARSGQPGARGGFLTVRNLVKRFGAHTALADVSLDIRAGELVCLLGPRAAARPRCCAPSPGWNARTAASSRCPAATSPMPSRRNATTASCFSPMPCFPI